MPCESQDPPIRLSDAEKAWRKVGHLLGRDAAAARAADGLLVSKLPLIRAEMADGPASCAQDPGAFWFGPTEEGLRAAAANDGLACLVAADGCDACLVARRDATCIDPGRSLAELTVADVTHILCLLKRSQAGPLQLLCYDTQRFQTDPWLALGDVWEAYDAILRELRSIVWDWELGEVASLPWYKVLNTGQGPETEYAALFEAEKSAPFVEGTEKMDGQFCQLRWRTDGRVVLSTTHDLLGAPDSEESELLAAVAEVALASDSPYLAIARAHPEATLLLELVEPRLTQQVIRYEAGRQGLWLTGARDVGTGRIWRHAELVRAASSTEVPVPALCCSSVAEAALMALLGEDTEGCVLSLGGRLAKIKTRAYRMAAGAQGKGFDQVLRAWDGAYLDDLVSGLDDEDAADAMGLAARISSYVQDCERARSSLGAGPAAEAPAGQEPSSAVVPGFLRPWIGVPRPSPRSFLLMAPGTDRLVDQREFERREGQLRAWHAGGSRDE